MSKGWIKLHRKILDNPFLYADPTARDTFIILLLLVDTNTGKWSGGRKQLSKICGRSEMTIYKAIQRLNREHMVNSSSNSKWTTHHICNWASYQTGSEQEVNSLRTVSEHSNKNKKEKEKEKKELTTSPREDFLNLIDFSEFESQFPTKDVRAAYENACDYLKASGKIYKDYKAFFRNSLRREFAPVKQITNQPNKSFTQEQLDEAEIKWGDPGTRENIEARKRYEQMKKEKLGGLNV